MEATALNRINLAAIPLSVKTDLRSGAIEMAQRHREDPGYRERYEKWLAEREKKSA